MPRVPTQDTFNVAPAVVGGPQGAMLNAPEVPTYGLRQAAEQSQALSRVGAMATPIAAQMQADANKARLEDWQNRAMAVDTQLRLEAQQLKGRDALERPDGKSLMDEFDERFGKELDPLIEGLGNDVQKQAARQASDQMRLKLRSALGNHMLAEQRTYRADTAKATIATAVERGTLLWGDEQERQRSIGAITAAVDGLARDNGWDKVTRDNAVLEATSPLHAGVIRSMIAGGNARQAREYYDANSAGMTQQVRAQMQPVLKEASDAQAGEAAVDAAWAKLGPRAPNDAVKLFDIETELRGALKDNPGALATAIASARQRAQSFNAQQGELKAQNVAGVWKLLDGGQSWAAVQRSDAWLALTDTERHEIRKARDAELYTQESRAAAREARAAAAEQRALAAEQRDLNRMRMSDALAFQRNGAEYLTMTDPDVLTRMSRAQVEATRGKFGLEGTQHLLQKWDALKAKPEKLIEARIDREDFLTVAQEMGLRPNESGKSEAEKDRLAALQSRVERLIDTQQSQGGKPLTRVEKMTLMRTELARTVAVDRGWFSAEKQIPVINLTPEDLKAVQVPPADRKQIVEALRARGLPATDENLIRRMYATRVSPAAAMVPDAR